MSIYKNIKKNKGELKNFIRFLKERNAYGSYFHEMQLNHNDSSSFVFEYNREYKAFFEKCDPLLWLQFCFIWSSTKKGATFWENLNNEWRNYYMDA